MEKSSYGSAEAQKFSSPEEEIAYLRGEILKKEKTALMENGVSSRQEIVRQELNNYDKKSQEEVLSSDYALKIEEIEDKTLHLTKEHNASVDMLVDIMEKDGIKNALLVAQKAGAHIKDDFHRFLVQYIAEFDKVTGLKEGAPLFKALRMKLFEVVLPRVTQNGNERKFAEIVTGMEQFYAGMLSIALGERSTLSARHFTIELAIQNSGRDLIFYCAVPRVKERLFEKQLLGVFPNAKIRERKEDYNIFNDDDGSVLASYAVSGNNEVLPIKTYDKFENDPLNIILSTFSKIEKEDEGAALQFVFSPAGSLYNNKYKNALERVRKGMSLKEATQSEVVKIAKEFGETFKDMFLGGSKTKKDDLENKEVLKEGEEIVQRMVDKISYPILDVNIRVVVSSASHTRSETILGEIESAFNQFSDPSGGILKFKRLAGKKLLDLVNSFTFRLYSKDESIHLNTKEITTMFHFPVTEASSSELLESKAKTAKAPIDIDNEYGDGIFIGVNEHKNEKTEIRFAREDRMRHFYVIGQTGTGKTTLLKNMITQDIANGDGVCMIDPHGSDIDDILANIPKERMEDVIYFDPAHTARPMGLNMLEYDINYPEQKTFVVNELFSIFQKLYSGSPESMGPMFEQYFRNSAMLVVEDPESGNTLLDVSRVMTDEKFRELKLSKSKNPVITQFWREVAMKAGGEAALANIVPYITSKFDVFLANDIMRPIIAQEHSSFDFRKIMDERKILLVNLSKGRLGDINSSLIGLIIVGKILMAALSRVDTSKDARADFFLYIDEFQNVTTSSISTILSEARKYRLSLNIAHQFIAQLDEKIRDSVFGNVGSIAAYRVGSEDAEFLEKQFSPVFSAKDIMNIENFNAYIKLLVGGTPAEPFNIRAAQPVSGDSSMADSIKQMSYLKYGRPRGEIEEEIARKYQK